MLGEVEKRSGSRVEAGTLECRRCDGRYGITRGVPRFVTSNNYAASFGLQWTQHSRIQYDSYNGTRLSEERFFWETKWPRAMRGDVILEVGSGAGRFTEQAASTGAVVVSLDYSDAVEANHVLNGGKDNVIVVQGDIYRLPVPDGRFDRVFCFGVLQHTPSPRAAFLQLPRCLKPGGSLAVDVYRKWTGLKRLLDTKYWLRPVTRRMAPEQLYDWVRCYIEAMWRPSGLLARIPYLGVRVNQKLLIADYRGSYRLPDTMLREWAILDTFDMLASTHDYPQSAEAVRRWFSDARLVDVEIWTENALIVGCARKPE